MHGKASFGETWDRWNSQIFQGHCPEPHKGVYSAPYEHLAARGQRADARWVMAYGHKTQSFMKNGGQQKCFDKTLNGGFLHAISAII